MQVTALAVLLVILFPVVSLTDDLQTYTGPAEIEHLLRRDMQDQPAGQVNTAAIVVAVLFSLPNMQAPGTLSYPCASIKTGTPSEESAEACGNRPPPCA